MTTTKTVRQKWILLFSVTGIGLTLDLITKHLAATSLSPARSVSIFNEVVQLYLTFNKGALFGLNPQTLLPWFPVNLFFYIFSVVAVTVLVFFYRNTAGTAVMTLWGLAFVMPGALGNLIDRILQPQRGVVDFIKIDLNFWPFDPWPIFNCADVFITTGIILLLIDMALQELGKQKGGQHV
ncbi:MAG: signal peptidase II [Chitinivibrionales bacterium]|nr:signal peptidase II [Chitinivibrionales bacterium]